MHRCDAIFCGIYYYVNSAPPGGEKRKGGDDVVIEKHIACAIDWKKIIGGIGVRFDGRTKSICPIDLKFSDNR